MDVAVNGTHNVLSSVAKNKESIRRVLVTSSFAGGFMCIWDGAVCLSLPAYQSSSALPVGVMRCLAGMYPCPCKSSCPGWAYVCFDNGAMCA